MKLIKLDNRYALSKHYSHRIEFDKSSRLNKYWQYWKIVKYMSESYGAGMPLISAQIAELYTLDDVTIWAHGLMSNGDPVVYLKEKSLTEFVLIPERFKQLVD